MPDPIVLDEYGKHAHYVLIYISIRLLALASADENLRDWEIESDEIYRHNRVNARHWIRPGAKLSCAWMFRYDQRTEAKQRGSRT